MEWKQVPLGPLQTNCYLVSNGKTKEAIIIDAGSNPENLLKDAKNYDVKAILLTHAHFDHIGGLNAVREQTKAPVYIHPAEQDWLDHPKLNGSARWAMVTEPVICQRADFELSHGDELAVAGFAVKVLHTPGHSPGSVTFVMDSHAFCGDALFYQSIGRTDLPGGNHEQLIESIQKNLMILPEETVCYPGHGPKTMVGQEKRSNPDPL